MPATLPTLNAIIKAQMLDQKDYRMLASLLPPSPRIPPTSRTLQAVSRCRHHSASPTDVLSTIVTCEWTTFRGTAHVDIHVYVHTVVLSLQGSIAVFAARQLQVWQIVLYWT
jgi:hypothetical protein